MEDKKLTAEEIDTIGEIMNISMGAAATAVSTMLEKQVMITTPRIEQNKVNEIDCSDLDPAIAVKINYIEGLTGTNVILLRRNDMRIILDLLMGNDVSVADDNFEFDEMSMSAASEVMNQMMGASSTALSELLGETVNISTPEATLINSNDELYELFKEYGSNDEVMSISFRMTIKETLDTSFSSILPLELTRKLVSSLNNEMDDTPQPAPQPEPTPQPVPQPVPQQMQQPEPKPVPQPAPQSEPQQMPQPTPQQMPQPTPQQMQQPTQQPVPQPTSQMPQLTPQQMQQPTPQQMQQPTPQQMQQPAPQQMQQPAPQQQPPMQYSQQPVATQFPPQYAQQIPDQYQYNNQNTQQAGTMPYQPQYPQQTPYPQQYMAPYGNEYYAQYNQQYQEPHANLRYAAPMVNVKQADFPEFAGNGKANSPPYSSNINMLMGVQLEVSVIVGRAKQKIKDVLDFGQGSVIELDKQTGAPAEIVVNGQLLAYGDVVVVGDNFGVRITEIVGTKELLDSLDAKK